jgi:hypothetical protein
MKQQKILFLTLIIFSLLFSGCFSSWQEDTGTIILNLGSNGRYVDSFPPNNPKELDELKYEITFTGTNDKFTLNSKGSQTVKTTVTTGEWKIMVKAYAYYPGPSGNVKDIYAFGKETVIVKPGQYNPVTVKMSNKGVVEINFVKLMSNNGTELPVENASFDILLNWQSIEPSFIGKGPHFIELEKGKENYNININKVYANYFNNGASVSELYINNNIKDNGYSFNINPGDHIVLFVTIKVDQPIKP